MQKECLSPVKEVSEQNPYFDNMTLLKLFCKQV